MNYIKFRFTLPPSDDDLSTLGMLRNSHVILYDKLEFMTCGLESVNNLGETCNKHIHIHFSTSDEIHKIRDRFRKWVKSLWPNLEWKKAELYSLKLETDVKEPNRFFRYPFKIQYDPKLMDFMRGRWNPEWGDIQSEANMAHDEWITTVEHNKKARDKALKPTTFDKIEKYLEELKLTEERQICLKIVEYYRENKLSANWSTMMGYCNTYRLIHNLMSDAEAVDHMLRHK